VCWHFVGFWSFMTEAVLYARPDGSPKIAQRPLAAKTQNRQPGAEVVTAANAACSLAVKDLVGDVQPRTCEGHAYKFHPSRNIVRADRGDFGPAPVLTLISGPAAGMVAVGGWSARVAGPDATPVETAPKKAE
jgi:hypothetical protein